MNSIPRVKHGGGSIMMGLHAKNSIIWCIEIVLSLCLLKIKACHYMSIDNTMLLAKIDYNTINCILRWIKTLGLKISVETTQFKFTIQRIKFALCCD